MDTRSKIVSIEALRRSDELFLAVAGRFDVLRAEHIRILRELKQRAGERALAAIVLKHSGEILAPRDRAELLAALRIIDYVAIWEEAEEAVTEALRPVEVMRMGPAECRLGRELKEHVRQLQTL